jgi:hypothetical protein
MTKLKFDLCVGTTGSHKTIKRKNEILCLMETQLKWKPINAPMRKSDLIQINRVKRGRKIH